MNDQQLINHLRASYQDTTDLTPPAGLTRQVRLRHRQQSRRVASVAAATPLVLGAAAVTASDLTATGHTSPGQAATSQQAGRVGAKHVGSVVLTAYTIDLPAGMTVEKCSANSVLATAPDGAELKVEMTEGSLPDGSEPPFQSTTVAGHPATTVAFPSGEDGSDVFTNWIQVPTASDPNRLLIIGGGGISQDQLATLAEKIIASPNNGEAPSC